MLSQIDPMMLLVAVLVLVAAVIYVDIEKKSKKSDGGIAVDFSDPNSWEIGPVIAGENLSHNVPLHPVKTPEGLQIVMPTVDGVHYVTAPVASLASKAKIMVRYRVDADPGVKFVPSSDANAPAMISAYFQRKGDDWSAGGVYEAYRWFASFATHTPVTVGEHTIEASLYENWTAVLTSSRANNLKAFHDALDNPGRVGLVFGGGTGLGHGMYATGPASITLLSFEII